MSENIIVNSFPKIFRYRIVALDFEKILELLNIGVRDLKKQKVC